MGSWLDRVNNRFASILAAIIQDAMYVLQCVWWWGNKNSTKIDLEKSPRLPFDNTEVVKHVGKGIVEIEHRSDDNLYIDGKKASLYLLEHQMGDARVEVYVLQMEMKDGTQADLNSNVLDQLYEHPSLFPEKFKKDKDENMLYIFFWGSIFKHPLHSIFYVRCLYWSSGVLCRDFIRFDDY